MKATLIKPEGAQSAIAVGLERAGERDGEAYRYAVGNSQGRFEVERVGPGEGWLRLDGRIVPFHAVRRDGRVWAWVGGRTFALEIADGAARRATPHEGTASHSETLNAPMPGTILKIAAQVGEAFAAHQPLVILESMKMELTLSVPHAGRVAEITCRKGQLVEMGATLVRLE